MLLLALAALEQGWSTQPVVFAAPRRVSSHTELPTALTTSSLLTGDHGDDQ